MPPAGDGDGRASEDRRGLERRLAVARQTVVARDAEVDRHDPFADQAMGQVAGDVGLLFAAVEVPAGRLDRQGQASGRARETAAVRAGSRGDAGRGRVELARQGTSRSPRSVATRLLWPSSAMMRPGSSNHGALLELEAEPRQLFLEDPGALHVVGDDGPAGSG